MLVANDTSEPANDYVISSAPGAACTDFTRNDGGHGVAGSSA